MVTSRLMAETMPIADGGHAVAHLQAAGITEGGCIQIIRFNMQNSQIGNRIGTDEGGREAASVGQLDGNNLGIFHHVAVGDDITLLREDHTGAGGIAAVEAAGN